MIAWEVEFIDEAEEDYDKLDGSAKVQVAKALVKLKQNPLPTERGGYGKPLGKRSSIDLSGLFKIKLRGLGIRIVYKLEESNGAMRVIVIGLRSDMEVYREAQRRRERYGL